MKEAQLEVESALRVSKEKMTDPLKSKFPKYEVGEKVWVSAKNVKTTRPTKQLDYWRLGPFEITRKISDAAYEVKLPETMRIHNVFDVGLLSRVKRDPERHFEEPPAIITKEGEEEFEVEDILESRKKGKG
jgi:hypothetical protein